jgi:4-amino-4-deoxy-L-arabinose transferase-like glycosyltransferase
LIEHERWARVAGIALGILALVHPPFGTLLGIYTLWVLLSHDAGAYDRLARMR